MRNRPGWSPWPVDIHHIQHLRLVLLLGGSWGSYLASKVNWVSSRTRWNWCIDGQVKFVAFPLQCSTKHLRDVAWLFVQLQSAMKQLAGTNSIDHKREKLGWSWRNWGMCPIAWIVLAFGSKSIELDLLPLLPHHWSRGRGQKGKWLTGSRMNATCSRSFFLLVCRLNAVNSRWWVKGSKGHLFTTHLNGNWRMSNLSLVLNCWRASSKWLKRDTGNKSIKSIEAKANRKWETERSKWLWKRNSNCKPHPLNWGLDGAGLSQNESFC